MVVKTIKNIFNNLFVLSKGALPGVLVIPYKIKEKELLFYLVKSRKSGIISFPSGRVCLWEDFSRAAERELKEETGLIDFDLIPIKIRHDFCYRKVFLCPKSRQQVFLARVNSEKKRNREGEIAWTRWFKQEKVLKKLTFDELKKTFMDVINYLDE